MLGVPVEDVDAAAHQVVCREAGKASSKRAFVLAEQRTHRRIGVGDDPVGVADHHARLGLLDHGDQTHGVFGVRAGLGDIPGELDDLGQDSRAELGDEHRVDMSRDRARETCAGPVRHLAVLELQPHLAQGGRVWRGVIDGRARQAGGQRVQQGRVRVADPDVPARIVELSNGCAAGEQLGPDIRTVGRRRALGRLRRGLLRICNRHGVVITR